MHGKAVRSKAEARSIDDLWANIRRLTAQEAHEVPPPPPHRTLPGQT